MAWMRGPLPPDTWWYGGVVPVGYTGNGFYFADFRGDHVRIMDGSEPPRVLKAAEVAWYDNSLDLPPGN